MTKAKIHLTLLVVLTMVLSLALPSYAASYQYDDLGRLTEVTYDTGVKVQYSYDAGGNMKSATTLFPEGMDITLDAVAYELIEGETHTLMVNAQFPNGTTRDVTGSASYASSNEAVAQVDEKGIITAVTPGTSEIMVTYGGVSKTASITVEQLFSISGYIAPDFAYSETAAPVLQAGFTVELVGTGKSAVTDENGYFTIEGIEGSEIPQTLKISKPNYLYRIVDNVVVTQDVVLSSEASPILIWAGDMEIDGVQDNAINMSDIMFINRYYNSVMGDGKYNPDADLNKDTAVNMGDIVIVSKHFNTTSANYPPLD